MYGTFRSIKDCKKEMQNKIEIGMPHLNYNGLDEVWLLKELGDIHWKLLGNITDMYETNDRYYASFFNVEIIFNQEKYYERELLNIESNIDKYNDKIYRSQHHFNNGYAILDSIFVKKNGNTLEKFTPRSKSENTIANINIEAHQMKKREILNDNYENIMHIDFNPVSLFNGVKILYCANYIQLVNQARWLKLKEIELPLKKIIVKYFGNISVDDKVFASVNNNETVLLANNRPIAYCEMLR